MEETLIDNRMGRLIDAGLVGKWFVDVDSVNLEDLVRMLPGGIVRCKGSVNNAVRYIPGDSGLEGCVAGWISEDEEV